MNNEDIKLIIWIVVIGGVFAFMWRKGYLKRIGEYFGETREELKKCTWPSKDELVGSTVVVLITTAMLGVFTIVVDYLLTNLVRFLT